ncbi:hypothetical protein DM02DRAFT_685785 [Periconia macrospinosa]|uniref:Uncharacterized protein n=1 Tax=Periconia macrospinosa TaxID=97972 RepID=A0A2V1DGI8_9PLEO|nr:hypothetical protein DM02DRAFT_685785 [Periconia macrospinosa]
MGSSESKPAIDQRRVASQSFEDAIMVSPNQIHQTGRTERNPTIRSQQDQTNRSQQSQTNRSQQNQTTPNQNVNRIAQPPYHPLRCHPVRATVPTPDQPRCQARIQGRANLPYPDNIVCQNSATMDCWCYFHYRMLRGYVEQRVLDAHVITEAVFWGDQTSLVSLSFGHQFFSRLRVVERVGGGEYDRDKVPRIRGIRGGSGDVDEVELGRDGLEVYTDTNIDAEERGRGYENPEVRMPPFFACYFGDKDGS